MADKDKPTLLVRREPKTGTLAYKLPVKGAKWRNNFADMDKLMANAMKDLPPPLWVEFTDKE